MAEVVVGSVPGRHEGTGNPIIPISTDINDARLRTPSNGTLESNPYKVNGTFTLPHVTAPSAFDTRQRIVIDEQCLDSARLSLFYLLEAVQRDSLEILEHRNPDIIIIDDPDCEANIPSFPQTPATAICPFVRGADVAERSWTWHTRQLLCDWDADELETIQTYVHSKAIMRGERGCEEGWKRGFAEVRRTQKEEARIEEEFFAELRTSGAGGQTADDGVTVDAETGEIGRQEDVAAANGVSVMNGPEEENNLIDMDLWKLQELLLRVLQDDASRSDGNPPVTEGVLHTAQASQEGDT